MDLTPEQQALQANAGISLGRPGSPWSNPIPKPELKPPVMRYTSPSPTEILTRPTGPESVDEQTIREATRKRMQTSIDAINANYVNLVKQERVDAADRSGQTRAINARSGLMGSDYGAAHQEKTVQYNKQQEKVLADEHEAKIATVMNNIEDRASQEIAARKAEAFDKAQAQARNDFQTLAQSGVDLNSLNPAQRAALLKQTGYNDQFGELIFNAMKPKPAQIDYKFEKLADGKGMFYGVDPQTGELKRIDVDVDLPPDWQMTVTPDGTIIGFDKNSGQTRMLSGQGQFADPTKFADSDTNPANQVSPDVAAKLGIPQGTTRKEALPFIKEHNEQIQAAKDAVPRVDEILSLIQTVYNHPGLGEATGAFRLGTLLPNSSGKDFISKFDQLKAMLSLDNIKYLKGTGSISDAEQQLLANAASSLRRSTSSSAFKAELERLYSKTQEYKQKLVEKSVSGTLDSADEFESQYENFDSVGSDTNKATGMRTDRHNNPAAFTTAIAKQAGLVEGKDYIVGDAFPNNPNLRTAKLIGNPVDQTIRVIDRIGFYTQSGAPRWSYVSSLKGASNWKNLSHEQKKNVVAQMYQHEGGSQLKQYFA
jgi:hypothetical protein